MTIGTDAGKPRVWLLSAYRTDSHRAWADGLVRRHTHVDWARRELPGRFFRWRIRGNPLSWLGGLPDRRPDLILATSMVDLATLRGLNPRLARVPAYYYFHENQFAYPVSRHQVKSVDPQMVQLYGALAAQRLLFNSAFNRDSFLEGVRALLRKMPDAVPRGVVEALAARAAVLPVPVEPLATGQRDPRLILWNHRWEYDKRPDLFARALLALHRRGVDFRLALLGARPEPAPEPLQRLRQALPGRIVADGRVDRAEYHQLLARAGIVVSTAAHEFQGLALLEAVSAGASPLVPDGLCYPEQYPRAFRYPAGDLQALVARLCDWLRDGPPEPPNVSCWLAPRLAPAWRSMLTPPFEDD